MSATLENDSTDEVGVTPDVKEETRIGPCGPF